MKQPTNKTERKQAKRARDNRKIRRGIKMGVIEV